MYEVDKAHQFLMGLNDDAYSTTRSQILALDPIPPLDKIFNMPQEEESHTKLRIARHTQNKSVCGERAKSCARERSLQNLRKLWSWGIHMVWSD